VSNLSLKSHII